MYEAWICRKQDEVPSWRIDPVPYGGLKDPGLGCELLRYAMEEMTEPGLLAIRPQEI